MCSSRFIGALLLCKWRWQTKPGAAAGGAPRGVGVGGAAAPTGGLSLADHGVLEIDKIDSGDAQCFTDYVNDVITHYRETEVRSTAGAGLESG